MAWIATIVVDERDAEVTTAELWDLGTNGVAELDDDGTTVTLLAGFESESDAHAALAALGSVTGRVEPVDAEAWMPPRPRPVTIGSGQIVIDAGRAFGHGDHPTTKLCLRLLADHVTPAMTVLDVGTGTGVLAVAAAALGADEVTAIDVDPEAVSVASDNAERNAAHCVGTIECSTTAIAAIDRTFDLVVANLLIADLEPIADHVRRCSKGPIIVSGVLIDQADRVPIALGPGMVVTEQIDLDGWAGLRLDPAGIT